MKNLALVLATLVTVSIFAGVPGAHASPSFSLKRYPYLTDDSGSHATVELATDAQFPAVVLTYGRAPGCSGSTATATGVPITVKSIEEYQFALHLKGLAPGVTYCYGVTQSGVNLLGSDPNPSFRSALPAWDPSPFSFAVIGDWGYTGSGNNSQFAALMDSIHSSGASFAVSTGDPAYNDGSQTNYGDLYQTGNNVSAVFGPNYWAKNGASMPMFSAMGDHGFSAGNAFLLNWDASDTIADSQGKGSVETYAGKDGTAPMSYPSIWYAFNWGQARFYILTGVWAYGNLGSVSQYQADYDYHWAAGAPELSWLQSDLAQHQATPKFAFIYFPFHSDSSAQPSDTYYDGPGGLESLLASNSVALAFNSHAHIYERNRPQAGSMATYIGGGGGGVLETVGACSPFDGYAVGWLAAKSRGSACNAPVPTSQNQVNEYTLVTVNGTQVTVAPVNANGSQFDVQTYPIAPTAVATPTHFLVKAPGTATAGTPFRVTLTAQDRDNVTAETYTGEHTLHWSGLKSSPNANGSVYPRNPVAFTRGVATVSLTPYAEQTASFTVSDGSISGTSPRITIQPTAATGRVPADPKSGVPIVLLVGALVLVLLGLGALLTVRKRARRGALPGEDAPPD